MRSGIRRSTVVLLAVSSRDAAAEIARHPGLRVARVLLPSARAVEGLQVTAVYATAAAHGEADYPAALAALRRSVAKSADLLPERVA